jgi:hypothetical protein
MRPELWMPGPRMAWVESRAPCGAQLKSWAAHGRRSRLAKQAMEELRKVGRSDRLPLFRGQSDRLGSWSDRQPLFRVRSDRLGSRFDRQQQSVVKNSVERGAPTVVWAWEPLPGSHPAVRCLNR